MHSTNNIYIISNTFKSRAAIYNEKAPRSDAPGGFGPSGATRTPGLLNPNQARYHLRYTRIFSFCYYTTLRAKIKDYPVCGHSCGQGRFPARFADPAKWRKRPCCKAFRASASLLVDSVRTTPKAGTNSGHIQIRRLYEGVRPMKSFFYPKSNKKAAGFFTGCAKIP